MLKQHPDMFNRVCWTNWRDTIYKGAAFPMEFPKLLIFIHSNHIENVDLFLETCLIKKAILGWVSIENSCRKGTFFVESLMFILDPECEKE